MPRALLTVLFSCALLFPASSAARRDGAHGSHRAAAGRPNRSQARSRAVGNRASRQPPSQVVHSASSLAPASRSASAPARRSPLAVAVAVAERYWGAVPCGGQVSVLAAAAVPAGMESSTDAWVTFESALGANDLSAPASSYTRCLIGLARWQWPTSATMLADWGMFCLTVVHEVGHLLGRAHSSVAGSVMAPVFTDESRVPAICRTTKP